MNKIILATFCALVLVAPCRAADSYQVVVNAKNPETSISKTTIRNYFMGKATRWPDGTTVKAIDLPESSPVREQFSRVVLAKDVAAVKSHWLTLVFAGRGTPPVQLESDEKVLSAVRANVTAIGYVSSSASLGGGVKAIPVQD